VSEPHHPDLPYSTGQIRRAGDRIRKAAERGEGPPLAEDLHLLNEYRAWHQHPLEACQRELIKMFHEPTGGLDPERYEITGRPLKTVEAITAKLVRHKMRLSRMQDIAGTRIVIPALELQDPVTTLVLTMFKSRAGELAKDTRERGDDFGYRAIHVVATE
jgi:ppGpp synthetase/RelA/SpoT-type nucleotidyltranferase